MFFLACVSPILFICGPLPTGVGPNNYPIQLFLDNGTSTTATFSGEPITAFITLPDSTAFGDIAWHLGNGHYSAQGIAPGKKLKMFKVELDWTSAPSCKDTATKQGFDSIYVSVAGETKRSNSVRVYVTNLPPVFDSIQIGLSSFKTGDTIRYAISDTLPNVAIKAYVSDLNRDTLKYNWYSARGVKLPLVPIVSYPVPKMQFTDTLVVTLYDGKGGQAEKVVVLSKLPPDNPPVIDSVKVGTKTYMQDTAFYLYSVKQIDTALLTVYSHDPDAGDSMTAIWSHKNPKDSLIAIFGKQFQVRLACDPLYVKSSDSLRTVDTISVAIKDIRGSIAKKTIRIIQGYVKHPPHLDSISVDNSVQCKGSTLLSRDTTIASYRDTIMFRTFASGLDTGDTMKLNVKAKQASCVTKLSDTTARYVCKDSVYTDTIVFIVKNLEGDSAVKRVVVFVVDSPPVLDSIRVNGKMQCKGATVLVRDTAICSAKDTLLIRAFASDPDSRDTVKLSVKAKQTSCVTKLSDTTARYVCKDSVYTDTISCVVKDLAGDSAVKKIVVSVIDRSPVLDSIRVNGAIVCKGTSVVASYPASGQDTFMLRIFASDPDLNDSVKLSIATKQPSCLTKLSDTTVQYICKDSLYTDTIACTASDLAGTIAKKTVIISIVNRLPVCDSISVLDFAAHDTSSFLATDSLISGNATIGLLDSVKVRLYAHDPDVALRDSIAQVQWTLSSGRTMKRLDTKGLFVQYPGPAAATTDTVSVKIMDTKQKSARMSLIFQIK